jgi:hypothetical protein
MQYYAQGRDLLALVAGSDDPSALAGWQDVRVTPANIDEYFPIGGHRNVAMLNGVPRGNTLTIHLAADEARAAAPFLLPKTCWQCGTACAPASYWIYETDQPLDRACGDFLDQGNSILVQLRGPGSITLVPPSIGVDGEPLRWDRWLASDKGPTKKTLAELGQAATRLAAAALLASYWPEGPQDRQDALAALAGMLQLRYWSGDLRRSFLVAVGRGADDSAAERHADHAGDVAGRTRNGQCPLDWPSFVGLLGPGRAGLAEALTRWLPAPAKVEDTAGAVPRAAANGTNRQSPAATYVAPAAALPAEPAASAPAGDHAATPEPYEPFPAGKLHAPLDQFVADSATVIGCDKAFVALPLLSALGAAIGNSSVIELKRGWTEPAVIWTGLVGESGTLKSPAMDAALSLDLDTTGDDAGRVTFVVDCWRAWPAPLWDSLATKTLVGHNLAFDLAFLGKLDFVPTTPVEDTLLLSQLLHAGQTLPPSQKRLEAWKQSGQKKPRGQRLKHRLEDCVQRELEMALDKTEQRSDWSGELTQAQLAYAARDAAVLVPLLKVLKQKIHQVDMDAVADIEEAALPAVVWLATSGVGFDLEAWQRLAGQASTEAAFLKEQLHQVAPPRRDSLFPARWNWDSGAHVKQVLALVGHDVEHADDETLAGLGCPLADLLRRYRTAHKRASNRGATCNSRAGADGRDPG